VVEWEVAVEIDRNRQVDRRAANMIMEILKVHIIMQQIATGILRMQIAKRNQSNN